MCKVQKSDKVAKHVFPNWVKICLTDVVWMVDSLRGSMAEEENVRKFYVEGLAISHCAQLLSNLLIIPKKEVTGKSHCTMG